MRYNAIDTNGRLTILNDGSQEVCFSLTSYYDYGNWTLSVSPGFGSFPTICYAQGKWVVVASDLAIKDNIYYNDDLFNETGWTYTYTLPGNINVYCSYADENGFLIGDDYGLYYSPDGISWSGTTITGSTLRVYYYGIAYGNGKYVVLESESNPDKIYYSADMVNWTNSIDITGNTSSLVRFANDKFYCMRNSTPIYYSSDAISWYSFTIPGITKAKDIAYGNGKYLILDETNGSGATSTDGINWSVFATGLPSSLTGLYFFGDKFLVSSFTLTAKIYSSNNGVNWTLEDTLPGWYECYCERSNV